MKQAEENQRAHPSPALGKQKNKMSWLKAGEKWPKCRASAAVFNGRRNKIKHAHQYARGRRRARAASSCGISATMSDGTNIALSLRPRM